MKGMKKILSIVMRAVVGIVLIYGLSVGVGAFVGYMIGQGQNQSSMTDRLTDAISKTDAPDHAGHQAEGAGHADAVETAKPVDAPAEPPPMAVAPKTDADKPEAAATEPSHQEPIAPPQDTAAVAPPISAAPLPIAMPDNKVKTWRDHAIVLPPYAYRDKKLIAIIFDDAGPSARRTKEVSDFSAALTISFLPYAPNLRRQINAARAAGHEVLAHVPMEALEVDAHPGPNALMMDMSDDEILENLRQNLDKFDMYIGVNNHMGSRLTADRRRMEIILKEIKSRNLVFVDSLTSKDSVAGKIAKEMGILSASRDVFLDDDDNPEKIREQFQRLMQIADKKGTAIAIGHPRPNTIAAFKEWLPSIENSPYLIVPLSVVLLERQKQSDKKSHE